MLTTYLDFGIADIDVTRWSDNFKGDSGAALCLNTE